MFVVSSDLSDLPKMSKQSPLDSFDTELFINETEQIPAILDSDHFHPATKKPLHGRRVRNVLKTFLKNPVLKRMILVSFDFIKLI